MDECCFGEAAKAEALRMQQEAQQAAAEAARQKAIEARKKALADPLPDPATVEEGVYAD